jgi:predicted ATPase
MKENPQKKHFYILTGGPGSGKTTLLSIFKTLGILCIEESGRKILQKRGHDSASSEASLEEIIHLMLADCIESYQLASKKKTRSLFAIVASLIISLLPKTEASL